MPLLFLILAPFILIGFFLTKRARRHLSPEQKAQVDRRSRHADIKFIVAISVVWMCYYLMPEVWQKYGSVIVTIWVFIEIARQFVLIRQECPADRDLPDSYSREIMTGVRVMQAGAIVFIIGTAVLGYFVFAKST